VDTDALEAIVDRLAIDDLLTDYAAALDDRDWDRLRSLFLADAEFDYTAAYGIRARRDEAVDWLAKQVSVEFAPVIQHHLTNRRWRQFGDEAEGTADMFNPDVVDGGDGARFLLFNGGRYEFTVVRTPDGWRFGRLAATVLWSSRAELFVLELPPS
jgi:hypothetical protein